MASAGGPTRSCERRADEPARRAWHLAEASTGPDEVVAGLLQEVAHANLFRGDSVGAIKSCSGGRP